MVTQAGDHRTGIRWWIVGAVVLILFVLALLSLLPTLGKDPASLFQPINLLAFFGPLVIPLLLLYPVRDALSGPRWIGLFLAVYALSLGAAIAYNLFPVPLRSRMPELSNWIGTLVSAIVAPTVFALLLAALLRRRRADGAQRSEDVSSPNQTPAPSVGPFRNPVVMVALIQAFATLLAALIAKLL